jgi:hypothetical protein
VTTDHDDVYKLAARLRALTLEDDIAPNAVLEIAGRLDAIGDQFAADEGAYAQALNRATAEIAALRSKLAIARGDG